MAKGLRSKVKKRWRSLKRKFISEAIVTPVLEDLHSKIQATINGIEFNKPAPLNAFKHPNDPNAVFPQYQPQRVLDLRSGSIPFSGKEVSGVNRKKNPDTLLNSNVIEEVHSSMEEDSLQDDDEDDDVDLAKDFEQFGFTDKQQQKKLQKKGLSGSNSMMIEQSEVLRPTKQINKNNARRGKARRSRKIVTF